MNNQIDTKSLESKLNEICKRCEYHLPFSDHTYDIVKALKRIRFLKVTLRNIKII